jgi:hypothetical protein
MKQLLKEWWQWINHNAGAIDLLIRFVWGVVALGVFIGGLFTFGWFEGDETKDATPTTQGENTNNAIRSEKPDNTKDLIREEPQITNEFNDNAMQGDYSNTNNNLNKQTDIPSDIYERGKLERAFRDATSDDPSAKQRSLDTYTTAPIPFEVQPPKEW